MNFNDFKNSKNVLSNEQMKNVKGGGTCGVLRTNGSVVHGYTKQQALSDPDMVRWCCDSCKTASWYGPEMPR
ncbi:MAG: TIGR04149 family rSAM-modified RiPP [Tenuifilaceae bacterium]|nr:TIGR04149 family rSAM-modified RiPP [Tenuifilaceae bacterium]